MFLKNLYKNLKKYIKNIYFNLNKDYEMVIYDDLITEPILECISPFKKVYIMKTREYNIFLTFKVIFTALRYFLRREILLKVLKNNIRNGILCYAKDAFHAGIINQLNPKTVISFIDNNPDTNNDNQCNICLSNLNTSRGITKLKCGHSYHMECINRWFTTNRELSCPYCRDT